MNHVLLHHPKATSFYAFWVHLSVQMNNSQQTIFSIFAGKE